MSRKISYRITDKIQLIKLQRNRKDVFHAFFSVRIEDPDFNPTRTSTEKGTPEPDPNSDGVYYVTGQSFEIKWVSKSPMETATDDWCNWRQCHLERLNFSITSMRQTIFLTVALISLFDEKETNWFVIDSVLWWELECFERMMYKMEWMLPVAFGIKNWIANR